MVARLVDDPAHGARKPRGNVGFSEPQTAKPDTPDFGSTVRLLRSDQTKLQGIHTQLTTQLPEQLKSMGMLIRQQQLLFERLETANMHQPMGGAQADGMTSHFTSGSYDSENVVCGQGSDTIRASSSPDPKLSIPAVKTTTVKGALKGGAAASPAGRKASVAFHIPDGEDKPKEDTDKAARSGKKAAFAIEQKATGSGGNVAHFVSFTPELYTSAPDMDEEQSQHWLKSGKTLATLESLRSGPVAARFTYANVSRRASAFSQAYQEPCKKIVESWRFELLSCVIILTNTLINAIEVEFNATQPEKVDDFPFQAMQWTYLVLFTGELCIRAFAFRMEFFTGRNCGWNCFDLLCVLGSMVELQFVLLGLDTESSRIVRMVRVLRSLKVLRSIRFFHELRQMLHALFGSMKSLFWLGVLLALMIFCFSMCILSGVVGWLNDPKNETHEYRHTIQSNFGSLRNAQMTLFATVTGGTEWQGLIDPLEEVGPLVTFFYVVYLTFTIFAFMNAVTSIFVDNATKATQRDRDGAIEFQLLEKRRMEQDLLLIFNEGDSDGSGVLSRQELATFLANERAQAYLYTLGIDIGEEKRLFELLDVDGNGEVDRDEFAQVCPQLVGSAKRLEVVEVKRKCEQVLRRVTRLGDLIHEQFLSLECRLDAVAVNAVPANGFMGVDESASIYSPPKREKSKPTSIKWTGESTSMASFAAREDTDTPSLSQIKSSVKLPTSNDNDPSSGQPTPVSVMTRMNTFDSGCGDDLFSTGARNDLPLIQPTSAKTGLKKKRFKAKVKGASATIYEESRVPLDSTPVDASM